MKTEKTYQCPECSYWAVKEGNRKCIPFSEVYTHMFRCSCGWKMDVGHEEYMEYDGDVTHLLK